MFVASGGRRYPRAPVPSFPLRASPNGRYLIDSNGVPFPVYDYAFWGFPCVSSTSDMNSHISKLQALGITTVHISAIVSGVIITNGTPPNLVSADRGGQLPLTKNNDSSPYTSTYGGNGDLSQTNDTYFSNLSTLITALQTAGMLTCLWPAYIGFGAGAQGWGADMTATYNNSPSKITTFATYIAGKLTQPNIVWMLYGDDVPTSTLQTAHAAFANTLIANVSQPVLVGGHLPSGDGDPASPNNTDTAGTKAINSLINLRTIYHWNASTDDTGAYTDCLTACQASPVLPTMKIDPAGYEGASGGNAAPTTPTGVRTDWWWSLLTSTMGVGWANDFTQYAGSQDGTNGSFTFANANTPSGYGSDGHKHLAVGTALHRSLPWWTLLPANVGSIGTIISSGQGASGTQAWIASAADPGGSCVVAYCPPSGGPTFSVNMTLLAGPCAAYWVDPTTGAATTIASPQSPLANTGTHSFTTPGNNAYGAGDWVLVLLGPNQRIWV